jgi:hypothetical protein
MAKPTCTCSNVHVATHFGRLQILLIRRPVFILRGNLGENLFNWNQSETVMFYLECLVCASHAVQQCRPNSQRVTLVVVVRFWLGIGRSLLCGHIPSWSAHCDWHKLSWHAVSNQNWSHIYLWTFWIVDVLHVANWVCVLNIVDVLISGRSNRY